uniref:Uncharacterized protein n=1 Tax=Setaria italica TaxID=4555 RepID=K3ZAY6_SETIT
MTRNCLQEQRDDDDAGRHGGAPPHAAAADALLHGVGGGAQASWSWQMGSPDNLPDAANPVEPADRLPVADQTSSTLRWAPGHGLARRSVDERAPAALPEDPADLSSALRKP